MSWPERPVRRRSLFTVAERYVPHETGTTKLSAPVRSLPTLNRAPLSPDLTVTLAGLSGSRIVGPLHSALLSEEDALTIADIACSDLSPAEVDAMDSWDLFCLACFLVTDGMSYAARPVAGLLTRRDDDGAAVVGPRLERRQFRDRLENLELRVVSLLAVFKDLRSSAWVAHRALRGQWRGLCRHYVTAVQAVHNALKRRSTAHRGTFVVPIVGRPSPWRIWAHAWLWWVDPAAGRIVAVDPTSGDALLDGGEAASLFNAGLDATPLPNVSAFAFSLLVHASVQDVVLDGPHARLLARLLDSDTAHGQIRLYQLSRHPVGSAVRTSILACLERRGFRNAYPGFDFGRAVFDRSEGREGFLSHEHIAPFVAA